MKRKSFLQPTNRTGVLGQKRRISGSHTALQLRSDLGLPIEKHSSTTSDLTESTIYLHDFFLKRYSMNRSEKKRFNIAYGKK